MIELNCAELQDVNGGIIQFLAGALVGGMIYDGAKVVIKCESNWQNYGTGSYDSLMWACVSDRSNWGI